MTSDKSTISPLNSTDLSAGLTAEDAAHRLVEFGANELTTKRQTSTLTILVRQFQSTVVLLLLVAAIASAWMHEIPQAIAIMLAVTINAVVGFFTELQANLSIAALETLASPRARVVRDGNQLEIPAREVVPGDLLILEAGARVAADVTLVEAASLSIEESMLSGESTPVYKTTDAKTIAEEENNPNIAYQGTLVLSGRGKGIATATGNKTKLGKLGQLLFDTVSTRTPLENHLEILGQQVTLLTVVLCFILLLIGLAHKNEMWLMLQTSVALAVAAIPEGMPVVATLALAAGTKRMVAAGTLIRQIAAVETLGCTTIICSDKTGTLTENEMVVTDLVLPQGRWLQVSGRGYEPSGEVTENGAVACSLEDSILVELLRAGTLCNDAKIEVHPGQTYWHVHGDPTEGAIIAAAAKIGLSHDQLLTDYPRIFELPFDLSRKRMTTIHQGRDGLPFACTKGSPGSLLSLCSTMRASNGVVPITDADRQRLEADNLKLAAQGLRVLGVATSTLAERRLPFEADQVEKNLTFLGYIAMADQPRAGVEEAIAHCHKAGIKVLMVTGDQLYTARAIGKTLHIAEESPEEVTFTGAQLETMQPDELRTALKKARVLARVTPEMKLFVVKHLQELGEIVAMTGDGVNDAPALRQANIGVAMGRSGTALAREASKMIITDDNFTSIVKAVEQGRIIYSNIRRAIAYLLTASLASVLAVFIPVVFATELPISPIQLLWLNLIMHVFPGLAIVLQPADPGIMNEPPRSPKEQLLTKLTFAEIIMRSTVVAIAVMAGLLWAQNRGIKDISTVGFTTLSFALLLQATAWAVEKAPSLRERIRLLTTRSMILNMTTSLLMLVSAIYLTPVRTLLGTHALDTVEILVIAGISFISFGLSALCSAGIRLVVSKK